ncbi:MAG: aldo/keto reductase, partial [Parachlamydia sp.]|nr:aldo/keto reductase [Parachlamydia sp.]
MKISEISYGSWITFGSSLDLNRVKECLRAAREVGINFFDTAEEYADGHAELLLGEAFKLYRREELVISTKIFWGGKGPNDIGLSWKHLVEGTKNSLRRLQLDYVDLLFCHRPDPDTPIEETVRAMDTLVRSGFAFYWGTSEWSAAQLEEAYRIAHAL